MKRIAATAGPTQTLCDAESNRGASWSRNDIIVFARTNGEIQRIPASGGTPQRVTTLDSSRHEGTHRWPYFLPDGNHFLFMAALLGPVSEDNVFYLGSLDGKQNRILFHGSSPIAYANGYLLYLAQNVLMARPFNPEKMEAGAPVPLFQTRLRKPVSAMEVVSYAVTGDGQRFLVNTRIDEPSAAPLSIILNWASEIER